jgi:hypothetical protein
MEFSTKAMARNISNCFLNGDDTETFKTRVDERLSLFSTGADIAEFVFLSIITLGVYAVIQAIASLSDTRSENTPNLYKAIVDRAIIEYRNKNYPYTLNENPHIEIPIEVEGVDCIFEITQNRSPNNEITTECGFRHKSERFSVAKSMEEFFADLEASSNVKKFIDNLIDEKIRVSRNGGADLVDKMCPIKPYVNLSNTCYVNSSIKLLIFSIGAVPLYEHLNELLKSSDNDQDKNALRAFLLVIADSCVGSEPLEFQLKSFLNALQKTSYFSGDVNGDQNFTLIGRQQDPQEFLMKLNLLFKLDKIESRNIQVKEVKQNQDNRSEKKSHDCWMLESNTSVGTTTLQDMFDEFTSEEVIKDYIWEKDQSIGMSKSLSYELNPTTTQIFHHISAFKMVTPFGRSQPVPLKVPLRKLNFDSAINFKCTDNGQQINAQLEAQHIIVHKGRSADSGHYYLYCKRSDGGWDVHNDAQISFADNLRNDEQAKIVNYKIIRPPVSGNEAINEI